MIPVAAILAALPVIERLVREAWVAWETPQEDLAWRAISLALSNAGAGDAAKTLEPYFRAAWRTYSDGELDAAWSYLRAKLEHGGELTRAELPELETAGREALERADREAGYTGPPTIPAPPPEHEIDPPHFDDGELATSVQVPHPHEGAKS